LVNWIGVLSPMILDKNAVFVGRKTRYFLVLFLLACLQIASLSVETRAQEICKIVSIDYQSEVIGGRSFTLTVTLDYSFSQWKTYSIRVDVFEGGHQSGTIYFKDALSSGGSVTVSGAGSKKFFVELKAPSVSKQWLLTAYACYQSYGGGYWWNYNPEGGYRSFTVLLYTRCRVLLKTSPPGAIRYAKLSGDGEYNPEAYVTLKADKMVSGATGTRYVFVCWTVDGRKYEMETPTIRIDRPEVTAIAEFKVQHELAVKSEFGDPRGSGWYDEGSLATFSVNSPVGFGIQHIFQRWSGDSTSASPSSTIVMNSPKTVLAVWRADYTVLIVVILVVVGASGAAIGFVAYTRKRRAAAPAAPLGVVHPEAAPTGMAAKPVPEAAPSAVKEVKEIPTPKIVPITEVAPPLDERVYDYIVEHEGTIALSQAAKDLGIAVDELNAAIERLKVQGRLA